jgi:phosphopantetheine adenylyltransferase
MLNREMYTLYLHSKYQQQLIQSNTIKEMLKNVKISIEQKMIKTNSINGIYIQQHISMF